MKNKLKNFYKISAVLFVMPFIALAQTKTIIKFQNPIKSESVSQVLTAFFGILVQIGVVAVTLAIVWAGFLFVAARGNPEQLNQAKKTFYWTIIGALVILGAQIIAVVIENTVSKL